MNFNAADIFFIIAIFELLFISAFLFTNEKGRRISNGLLGTFFLSLGLNLLDSFLQLNNAYFSHPSWAFWGSCLPLLFGPLLYLYVQSLLYKDFKFAWSRGIHIMPFVIFFLLTEVSYLSQSREFQQSIFTNLQERNVPGYLHWAATLIFIQFFSYTGASLRLIANFKKEVHEKYSNPLLNNISWLSSAIVFFMMLMIISAFNQFTALTLFAKYYFSIFAIIIFLLFVFISRILFKALGEGELFSLIEEKARPDQSLGLGLNVDDKSKIVQQLQEHMRVARPFLESDLTLEQLAGQLSLRPKVLSHVINESLNQNFFDFINRYRIEEAKQLLTNPTDKRVTVLEVLYQVGFNSKSSFNTLFKKYTGVTPSEFKKSTHE